MFDKEMIKDLEEVSKILCETPDNKTKSTVNNNAEINGEFDVAISKNEVTIKSKDGKITATAKCHPDDAFDFGEGFRVAMERFKEKQKKEDEIKVGDTVEIVDPGEGFSTDVDFFKNNNLIDYGMKYRYGVVSNKGTIGKVVYIGRDEYLNKNYVVEVKNEHYEGNPMYRTLSCDPCYLMLEKGIKKVK